MHIYEITHQLLAAEKIGDKPVVIVAAEGEAVPADFSSAQILPWHNHHFCKAELYADYLSGTFFMPRKHEYGKDKSVAGDTVRLPAPALRCSFVLNARGILFIDDGSIEYYIRRINETRSNTTGSLFLFFGNLLMSLIENDMAHFSGMQLRLLHLEKVVLNGNLNKFNQQIMPVRREIIAFTRYYSQLIDMTQQLLEYAVGNKAAKNETALLRAFVSRAGRLRDEAQALREYSNQVRDIYHSEIDIHQNQIMKLFTVVTTIFMPLTLVVGWYGMNFDDMPELHWKYGYPAVGVICISIITLCFWLFTKKKYW